MRYLSPDTPAKAKILSPEAIPSLTHKEFAGNVYVADVAFSITSNVISLPT